MPLPRRQPEDLRDFVPVVDPTDAADISVVHVPGTPWSRSQSHGGVTVAYRRIRQPSGEPGSRIEIAVATCHPEDRYVRKVGWAHAVSALINGRGIEVPNLGNLRVHELARAMGVLLAYGAFVVAPRD